MQNHWKKHNHKIETDLSSETLKGKKTRQKFLYIDVEDKTPKKEILLLVGMSLSLSYALYTSECVSSNEEHSSSIYTLFVIWLLT